MTRAWINGAPVPAVGFDIVGATPYGHFTTLQVRGGAAQGLDLHLSRLQEATLELFGVALAPERLRRDMRAAVDQGGGDCTLRVAVHARHFDPRRPGPAADVDVMVAVAPPGLPEARPLRLKSVAYMRELPHLKHSGLLPLYHRRRLALAAGFDDALLVGERGQVSEGTFWNIGFFDQDGGVVWPQAPALRGTCERLLQAGLEGLGINQRVREVRLPELRRLGGAFAANARGIQAVASIDEVAWAPQAPAMERLNRALASHPWQAL